MPLQPNFIERQLNKWGKIPGPMLDAMLPSFKFTAMIGAGKIGLFRTLNEEPSTVESLSEKTKCDEQALKNLLRVLELLGYVEVSDGVYSLTKYARKVLPVNIFQDIAHFAGTQMQLSLENLERALREAPEEGAIGWEPVKEGEFARTYQVTMRWLASQSVEEVAKKVDLPEESRKMLDIGGSHGLHCVEMCRKYPELEATVMDWPVGIENAQQTLKEESDVADRINTLEGDFFKDEFPEGYDYAFFGNIIHGNSPEQNRKLFNRLGEKLSQHGTIGILDQFNNVSGSHFTQSVASLVGWQLFLFTSGRAYEAEKVQDWLSDAGFPNSRVMPLKKNPGFTLLTASR